MIVTIGRDIKSGVRVDIFVLEQLKLMGVEVPSRSFLHKMFKEVIKVNGKEVKSSYKLKYGDVVNISEEKIEQELNKQDKNIGITAQEGKLDIIHETEQYLVINKPKGITVHPGIKNTENTLVNFVRGYLEKKGEFNPRLNRAGLVHRLDKGVSGIMVFAKTVESQEYLQKEFENHTVKKIYLAKTEGSCELTIYNQSVKGELDTLLKRNFEMDSTWTLYEGYIGRDRRNRLRMKFKKEKFPNSKKAISFVKRIGENEFLVSIETGRMHQIRATLAHIGIPIQGDTLYRKTKKDGIPEEIELESILISFKDMDEKTVTFRLY
ncbi:MAG TPA: RluA family pseudouridine synthase [Candidatus Dojkabacteria bacterium]|nr:RluA family pseudouridine synthase [Candidatus Dojkabacteria bacterium]